MQAKTKTLWTFAITSVALFMVVLDNLVVSTALPVIRTDLGATIEQLEWTVNAYTLTFAVFLQLLPAVLEHATKSTSLVEQCECSLFNRVWKLRLSATIPFQSFMHDHHRSTNSLEGYNNQGLQPGVLSKSC